MVRWEEGSARQAEAKAERDDEGSKMKPVQWSVPFWWGRMYFLLWSFGTGKEAVRIYPGSKLKTVRRLCLHTAPH